MQLGVISVSFKQASQDVRDQVAFTDSKKIALSECLYEQNIEQSMVLSTCNRSELYFLYEDEQECAKAKESYIRMFPNVSLDTYLIEKQGEDALTYLFEMAAGLQSMIIGEDQILGQLQDALDFSRAMGYSKKELNKIVRDAVTCAKKMKTTLKISEHPLSVSYIGIRQLEQETGFAGKAVFLIGSGKMATLALRYVIEYGAEEIYVCSKTKAHTRKLMEEFPQIRLCDYEQRYKCMRGCDIVISATSAPHTIVKREEFSHEGEIYLLDLASPRDIDPAIGTDRMVHLHNIDSLKQMADENLKKREELVEQANEMIRLDVNETSAWLKISRVDATIESLQMRCQEILSDSYEYINRKLELDTHEKKVIENTLHASLQRLLREPIHTLKGVEDERQQKMYQEVTEKLFRLR